MRRRDFNGLLASFSMTAGAAKAAGQPSFGPNPAKLSETLIGMQYENWFVPGQADWTTAEALPVLGKYSSMDPKILRKHFEWFSFLGIDWLLIDWSNLLWMKPLWEEQQGASLQLEKTVDLMFQTCHQLRQQGKYAPKLVFMLGLQNGPPVPDGMKRLNHIVSWLTRRYLQNPAYQDQLLPYEGKPLLTILYWPRDPCSQIVRDLKQTALHSPGWTVRWMSTQLQDNHADRCGMWSWMDGTIRQKVTYHNGAAEETIVTPACFPFPAKGWLHSDAVGRDHGTPYLESWKVAFDTRPKFIQIHQWNEFAGQKDGQGFPVDYWGESGKPAAPSQNVFGDEYNQELSDDLEPTQLSGCGYRACGGWGYYYLNLTKALISLYRKQTPDITVLAASVPSGAIQLAQKHLRLTWKSIGRPPTGYSIFVDGKGVARELQGSEYELDLAGLSSGKHEVMVRAEGAHTYFDLSPEKITSHSEKPLPVQATVPFSVAR